MAFESWLSRIFLALVFLHTAGEIEPLRAQASQPSLVLREAIPEASPPLPDPSVFPFQLVLDDDAPEGVIGFIGPTARQFVWLNSFANPGPFNLNEIWVLFPSGSDVPIGGAIQLLVYLDPDGDPSNGADLLGAFDETIQAVDGVTFSVYPIPTVLVDGPGNILIGVVNRYFQTGIDPPPTLPASVDTTVNQMGSYLALWPGDPPSLPDLATAIDVPLLDGILGGNLMIRGFGTDPAAIVIPSLSPVGLGALAALIVGLGLFVLRRLR